MQILAAELEAVLALEPVGIVVEAGDLLIDILRIAVVAANRRVRKVEFRTLDRRFSLGFVMSESSTDVVYKVQAARRAVTKLSAIVVLVAAGGGSRVGRSGNAIERIA